MTLELTLMDIMIIVFFWCISGLFVVDVLKGFKVKRLYRFLGFLSGIVGAFVFITVIAFIIIMMVVACVVLYVWELFK